MDGIVINSWAKAFCCSPESENPECGIFVRLRGGVVMDFQTWTCARRNSGMSKGQSSKD